MVEEIATDLFRIEVPLPETPLKYLNAYAVRASERNLVIDTGLNHKTCLAALMEGLKQYLTSLAKVRSLAVERVLPGHRRLFNGFQERIDELIAHHRTRLDEVMTILEDGSANAYEVASRMRWDIQAPNWASFPPAQQWFATGEAIAHLHYLEDQALIQRSQSNGVVQFNRADED